MTDSQPPARPEHQGDTTLAESPPRQVSAGLDGLTNPAGLIAGGLLAAYALKRRDLVGLFSAGVSAGLLYRSARQNGLFDGGFLRRLFHTANRRLVPFERQLIIDRGPSDVYEFWRHGENLGVFLPRIRDIRPLGDDESLWQFRLTDEIRLEWTAQLVADVPEQLLVWRTVEPSDLHHEGWVSFDALRNGASTRVTIRLYLLAPLGEAGARILEWIDDIPVPYFSTELQRIRTVLEDDTERFSSPALRP